MHVKAEFDSPSLSGKPNTVQALLFAVSSNLLLASHRVFTSYFKLLCSYSDTFVQVKSLQKLLPRRQMSTVPLLQERSQIALRLQRPKSQQ